MASSTTNKPFEQLILITGFARSGTTWIGEQFAENFDVDYIFEPFSIKYHPEFEHSLHLRNIISNYFDENYYEYGWEPGPEDFLEDQQLMFDHLLKLCEYYQLTNNTLIIKQPLTTKLRWVLSALNPDHLIWIDRHPAGILASMKQKNTLKKITDLEFKLVETTAKDELNTFNEPCLKKCKESIQKFISLYFNKRRKAFKAIDQFKNHHVLSYEDICFDSDIITNKGVELNLKQHKKELNKDYKKGKKHLNTNQDSEQKALGWKKEVLPSTLAGMYCFFRREPELNHKFLNQLYNQDWQEKITSIYHNYKQTIIQLPYLFYRKNFISK
jgi:hypothetical protein